MAKILFVGNGLIRALGGNSWDDLLKSLSIREDFDYDDMHSPMPLRAVLLSNNTVEPVVEKFSNNTNSALYGGSGRQLRIPLQSMKTAGITDIITTNYSYEIEKALLNADSLSRSQISALQSASYGRAEPKYCIRTYNKAGDVNIWHIHGEARKKTSILLTHSSYCRFLYNIQKYLSDKFKSYQSDPFFLEGNRKSWLDMFILDDVFIMGFGYDFSEMDLWWLIQKKSQQPNRGRTIFFEPEDIERQKEKVELLKIFGVEIESLGYSVTGKSRKERTTIYKAFYNDVIKYISES